MGLEDAFLRELSIPLVYLVQRTLPFLVAALAGRGVPWGVRTGLVGWFGALALATLLVRREEVVSLAVVANAYFLGMTLIVHGLSAGGRGTGQLRTLAVCLFLYVLAPLHVVPGPYALAVAISGWELALSAQSYWMHRPDSGSWRAAAHFVLVNPTLLYTARGEEVGGSGGWSAVGRGAAGIGATVGQVAMLFVAAEVQPLGSVPYLAATLVALYLGHSGRASHEVALMRLLGWRIPERYDQPYLARSPADFWRRWNGYLGAWARAHLFLPLALALRRWSPGRSARLLHAVASIATLSGIGLLHDLSVLVTGRAATPGTLTLGFAAFGLLVAGLARARGPAFEVLWRVAFLGVASVVVEALA